MGRKVGKNVGKRFPHIICFIVNDLANPPLISLHNLFCRFLEYRNSCNIKGLDGTKGRCAMKEYRNRWKNNDLAIPEKEEYAISLQSQRVSVIHKNVEYQNSCNYNDLAILVGKE